MHEHGPPSGLRYRKGPDVLGSTLRSQHRRCGRCCKAGLHEHPAEVTSSSLDSCATKDAIEPCLDSKSIHIHQISDTTRWISTHFTYSDDLVHPNTGKFLSGLVIGPRVFKRAVVGSTDFAIARPRNLCHALMG